MRYNKALGIPPAIIARVTGIQMNLTYSRHSLTECLKDRETLVPPKALKLTEADIVEIETDDKRPIVNKVVARIKGSTTNDIVMVILPEFAVGEGFVKTLWLNDVNDHHTTLRAERFS